MLDRGNHCGSGDVWVCNSDGYVGQVCILSMGDQIQVKLLDILYRIIDIEVLWFMENSFASREFLVEFHSKEAISHSSLHGFRDSCDIVFLVKFNFEFPPSLLNSPIESHSLHKTRALIGLRWRKQRRIQRGIQRFQSWIQWKIRHPAQIEIAFVWLPLHFLNIYDNKKDTAEDKFTKNIYANSSLW